jgi:glycosyltransferase involved in cell wall biosynthesis
MKIIHVLHSHDYGGAESHALIMMRGQRARGHDVMFAGPQDSWLGRACREHGIAATHIRLHGLFDVRSHCALRSLVREWQADVVHGHLVRASFYAGWAGRAEGAPVAVCTAHTTNALKHMGRCAHIVADSQAIAANLVAHGYAPQKVSVIYTGVPRSPRQDRAAVRRELGFDDDDIVVGHAGRFIRDKGQDVLVRAMALVQHPRVKLVMIGRDDTAFAEQVHQYPQDPDRVRYLGYRPDVQRVLQALDLYVQPSRREGLPLAVSEAFDAGLPVVASRVGGVPEIVRHGETGWVVEPDDPQGLAQAIDALATDRALASRLAHAGQVLFETSLTDDIMVDQALALYRSLLAARHGPIGAEPSLR